MGDNWLAASLIMEVNWMTMTSLYCSENLSLRSTLSHEISENPLQTHNEGPDLHAVFMVKTLKVMVFGLYCNIVTDCQHAKLSRCQMVQICVV